MSSVGDGHPKRIQPNVTELRVFIGVTGSELFARRPQKVAVAMPCYEYIWLVDLNKDAKSAAGI